MERDTVIAFLAGTILGAVGAAVFVSKRFEKVIDQHDQDWQEYTDYLESEHAKNCEACQQNHEKEIVEDDDIDIDEDEAHNLVEMLNTMATSDVDEYRDEAGVVAYDQISKQKVKEKQEVEESTVEVEEIDEETEEEAQEEAEELDEPYVHIVDKDDYEDPEYEEYEKIELTYLEGSDIFLTDCNDKYNAYPAIAGRETLEDAFRGSADGYAYIRNEALELDFCIVSDIRTYDEYIKETAPKE